MTDWAQAAGNAARTAYQGSETLGTSYSVAWRYQHGLATPASPEKIWPQHQPIVSAGAVFVGTLMGNLRALDAADGTVLWTNAVGAPIMGSVAADGTTVYVGDAYGRLTAYDISSGDVAWGPIQLTDGKPFYASLLYADGLLMLGGADGTFFGVDPSDGSVAWSYDAGAPILQTAAGDDAGKVVFGCMDMTVACLNTSTGAENWRTSALVGSAFKDYWPVIVGSKVIIRPQAAYPFQAFSVSPSTPTRGIEVDDWTSSGAMNTALAAYDASPSSYARTLYVLDLADGSDDVTNQIIHWHWPIAQHGAQPPPCLDKDGYLVIGAPRPTDGNLFGWVRVSLSTRKVVDGLVDGSSYVTDHGWGNRDENMALSACSNGILAFHCQEANAQTTGFFQQTGSGSPAWRKINSGTGTGLLLNNTQGGGAAPAAISGGLVYHLAYGNLVAWSSS